MQKFNVLGNLVCIDLNIFMYLITTKKKEKKIECEGDQKDSGLKEHGI